MALVVETTSSAQVDNSDSVVVTKPTGVQSGDLLLIAASGYGTDLPACTGFTEAVSKTTTLGTDMSISLLYRIADSSDVSASDYTVTLAGAQTSGVAAMMRVSGWNTGNPVYASASGEGTGDGVTTSGASGLSVGRPSQQLLIIINGFKSYLGSLSNASFSGYSITSSDSNPTWTEVCDTGSAIAGSSANIALSVAYALSTDTSTITAYNTNVSSDVNGDIDLVCSLLVVITSPVSVTASNALFQTSPVTFATLTGSTQSVTNNLLEVTPEIETQSVQYPQTTAWSAETKPSTTWESET